MTIPIINLQAQYKTIESELESAVLEVLRAGHYVLGPKVAEFESQSAKLLNVKHAISCANGSDALYLALLALGVAYGDEVITTPFTYIATAEAISQIGAKPVFADIDLGTYNIDPAQIETKITHKTKAIMIVHLYGQCCDMDAIMAIANKHGLKVIEDSAQAFGATCLYQGRNKSAGTIGDIGTYSFYPTKNLSCAGDGGLLVTNSDALAESLKRRRIHGTVKRYYHSELGVNSRLDELQAAILLVKLKYIQAWNQKRQNIAKLYDEAFKNIRGLITPKVLAGNYHIYHQYTLRLTGEAAYTRDELKSKLQGAGIASEIYYPLALHMQEVYKFLGHQAEEFPNALKAAQNVLCLPIYPELSSEQINKITKAVLLQSQASPHLL